MRGRIILAATLAVSVLPFAPMAPLAQEQQKVTAATANTPEPGNAQTWSLVLDNQEALGILGREVRSNSGEDMGRLVNVIVDQTGQVRAAVIDFGGFLGVGSRRIVVDWSTLHFSPGDRANRITTDLTRDQVRAAPDYREGKPVVVVGSIDVQPPPARSAPEM
jgi:hypothetical protein